MSKTFEANRCYRKNKRIKESSRREKQSRGMEFLIAYVIRLQGDVDPGLLGLRYRGKTGLPLRPRKITRMVRQAVKCLTRYLSNNDDAPFVAVPMTDRVAS